MYFTARCGKISRYLFKMSGINRLYGTVVDQNANYHCHYLIIALYKNVNNLDQFKRVQNDVQTKPPF
jgi:hypothetical protein